MIQESQKFLLNLARRSLDYYFKNNKILKINENELTDLTLKEKRGIFVTLTKKGQLRGCIGHLEAIQPIYLDVIENSLSAAFNDRRFIPLQESELADIKMEISVLTKPQELKYCSLQDLLDKLIPFKNGVIIEKGKKGATYLPQVWEDLPNKEDFLNSLCEKAGLDSEEWKRGELKVYTYEVEAFAEKGQKG